MIDAQKHATYADLEAVPPHLVAEILGGELVTHSRPAPRYSIVANALSSQVYYPYQRDDAGWTDWIFCSQPEVHLGSDVIVPNLAGWLRKNLGSMTGNEHFQTAPDWACEVTSPATEFHDRGIKSQIYAQNGVKYLWLIDPQLKILEAFKLAGKDWLLIGTVIAGQEVSIEPFNAISFPLSVLFPFDPPNI